MSRKPAKPLPLYWLVFCLVVLGVCGAVCARELYYALASRTTLATIRTIGQTSSGRSATFWAEYEYVDAEQVRHVGQEDHIFPSLRPGDQVAVQYLWHAPGTSRFVPSAAKSVVFGGVALLAGAAFVAELLSRRMKRRRAPHTPDSA